MRGVAVCREISRGLGLHMFATDDEDAVLGDAPPPLEATGPAGPVA